MLIQLRQSEIEAALKMYVISQGFSLNNKSVNISFTSGRKDNGISADLDIEDTQQTLKVVYEAKPAEVVKDSCPIKDPEEATDETDFPQDTGEPVAPVETKAATSLFG